MRLPDDHLRDDARRVYGLDPEGYESGRPQYPERVYEILSSWCGLRPGSAALEIGPGTGRVTNRLLAAGAQVVAVEPDPALAQHLLAIAAGTGADAQFSVVLSAFEDAPLDAQRFDLVVSAMAFHWVDQDIGLPKLGRVLRPGGSVALWWTLFGDADRPDPFRDAARELLDAPSPDDGPPAAPFELDVDGWRAALTDRAGLVGVEAEMVRWTAVMDVQQLRAFYASTIAVRRRPEPERGRLLDRLADLASNRFGGRVERPFVTAVYTAHHPQRECA